jgi:hypothetical protein
LVWKNRRKYILCKRNEVASFLFSLLLIAINAKVITACQRNLNATKEY